MDTRGHVQMAGGAEIMDTIHCAQLRANHWPNPSGAGEGFKQSTLKATSQVAEPAQRRGCLGWKLLGCGVDLRASSWQLMGRGALELICIWNPGRKPREFTCPLGNS